MGRGIDSNLLSSRRQSNNAGSIMVLAALELAQEVAELTMSNNSSGTDANIGGASASGKQNAQNAELKNACERATI